MAFWRMVKLRSSLAGISRRAKMLAVRACLGWSKVNAKFLIRIISQVSRKLMFKYTFRVIINIVNIHDERPASNQKFYKKDLVDSRIVIIVLARGRFFCFNLRYD